MDIMIIGWLVSCKVYFYVDWTQSNADPNVGMFLIDDPLLQKYALIVSIGI